MERMPFWIALEEEVAAAKINGRSIIIQFEANAKLSKTYIKRDPKEMSGNGRILAGILERHALVVVNGLYIHSSLTKPQFSGLTGILDHRVEAFKLIFLHFFFFFFFEFELIDLMFRLIVSFIFVIFLYWDLFQSYA